MTGKIAEKRRLDDNGEWIVESIYFVDGEEVSLAVFRRHFPDHEGLPALCGWSRPLKSDAMAVHPSQIEQVKARNRKHGLNVDYDKIGRPILTDAGQRRKLMKIEGFRQMNSYYGA